eukprot:TRINITY_DN17300_c0_g1_i2.p1 TRINITY_DN17300_c0_g1~~TRINITY_DN17300_c0_g1_i2.p1  ORF type:complete len:194 (+),score=51.39 TRINITY_DN17300_c0_g1_i2:33-614(+)
MDIDKKQNNNNNDDMDIVIDDSNNMVDDEEQSVKIKLLPGAECNPDDVVLVDIELAKQAVTLKAIIDDLDLEFLSEELIPVPQVERDILEIVFEYCKYHKSNPNDKPLGASDISEWDQKYCDRRDEDDNPDYDVLFNLVLAANYLDIRPLLEVTCKYIGYKMKTMSVDEIRDMYNIESDFTEEEFKKLQKENE